MMLVPVVDKVGTPLQPAHWAKVRRWIKEHRCLVKKRKGIFYVQLKKVVKEPRVSEVYVGIDPGSKMTGITVAIRKGVILNLQLAMANRIKEKLETRRMYRKNRKYRKTPYRIQRSNRRHNKLFISPSIKARWDRYINLIKLLKQILNISNVAIEDINAKTLTEARKWNVNFSPIEIGKNYFYNWVIDNGFDLTLFNGYDTKAHRDLVGYKKSSKKLDTKWECHCVDSHSLIEMNIKKLIEPKKVVKFIKYIEYPRRELFKTVKGKKQRYGGTRSLGFNKGSLVWHDKYKLCLVGGNRLGFVSLHNINGDKRLSQYIKTNDIKLITCRH